MNCLLLEYRKGQGSIEHQEEVLTKEMKKNDQSSKRDQGEPVEGSLRKGSGFVRAFSTLIYTSV